MRPHVVVIGRHGHHHGAHAHSHAHAFDCCGHGPGMGYRSRREIVRELEEYQKDLEQELADVADRISELKAELDKD